MKKIAIYASIITILLCVSALPVWADTIFYNSSNRDAVTSSSSGPPTTTDFTLTEWTRITRIQNYHYGSVWGTDSIDALIGIADANGNWLTDGWAPTYTGNDDDWYVLTDIVLGPGDYRVVENDIGKATWSYDPNEMTVSVDVAPWPDYLTGQDFAIGRGFSILSRSDDAPEPPVVPEPATMLLLGSGLIGLAGYRKRTRRS